MKNRNGSVMSAQAVAPALVTLLCLLIPGSVALSQPFPSFVLDTSVTYVPGYDNVSYPYVAFGPDLGLVVWVSEDLVRGARVDHTGALLDSVQIDIDGLVRRQRVYTHPGVAWSGQNFLVLWADEESMKYALIEPDGSISSRSVLRQQGWQGGATWPSAAAFDGTNFLAAWIGWSETLGQTAYFCRITPEGALLDSPPRMVAPLAAGRQENIALCFHEGRYLAVWNDWDTLGISGNFIFPNGSIADSAGFRIRSADYTERPTVSHDRENFLVSWREYTSTNNVRLTRVSDSGVVLDSSGVLVDSFAMTPAIVSNGDTTLVTFLRDTSEHGDSTVLVGVRFDAGLNRLDPVPVVISATGDPGEWNGPENPFAAMCGEDYFVAWTQPLCPQEYTSNLPQVLCRRVNENGEVVDSAPAVVSLEPARQAYPDVATDGANFLAVWPENRQDFLGRPYFLIQCSRFTADGARLDPNPISLGKAPYDDPPAVAFGGGCYLVTWQDSTGVSARRVTPAGVLPDSAPLRLPEPLYLHRFTDVAYGDSFFLVAWASGYSSTTFTELAPSPGIHGSRVTPAGTILDPEPLRLSVAQSDALRLPKVGFDGTNFLVARRDGGDEGVQRCVRVSQDGAILDTADITLGPAGGNYHPWPTLDVAFGDGVYFVIDNQTGRCSRVSPNGLLIDTVVHAETPCAHVVFDGTDFVLICQMTEPDGTWADSLGAIRITSEGRVLDSVPFVLVAPDSAFASAYGAAASANAAGVIATVFRSDEPAPYLTYRIRAATFPAIVGIGSQRDGGQSVVFRVQPNPAASKAYLSLVLGQAGPVQVTAFDATGRRCVSLFSGRMKAGSQTLSLDTRRLTNGVYFLRLEAGATRLSTRLVVAR